MEEIGAERYREILERFGSLSVLVLGDLMMDEYLRGSVRRISPEGPVMVVEVESDEFKPGGAANVGNNLRALGAGVRIAGVVGDDDGGGAKRPVDPRNRLHQRMRLHRLVDIQRGQTFHIETGQPHRADEHQP